MKRLFKLLVILALVYTSYASCATIQGNLNVKSKLEVSKTGKFIDGVQSDTWISIIKSNAKIRYNNGINKWQFTNDGTTWYDFVTEGGGGGGGGISGSGTTGTIAKWNTSSSLTDSSISETTPTGRTTGTAFNSDTYIESGLFIKVMSSKPSAPPAGRIAIYYRNGAMYYQDSAGTETEMCRATGGTGDDETIYETDIVFNFNGADLQDYTTSETGFGRILKAETSGFGKDFDGGGSLDTADKKYGTASLYFGGMGKGMLLENTKGFELLTDNWTFEFWIKFHPNFLFGPPQTFLYCGTGNFGANDFYRIYYEPGETAGYLYFIAYKNGSCIASYYSETVYSTMEDGGWHHLAFVRNGNNMLMFVDGDKKTVTANTSFSSSISNIPGFIILGADGDGAISMYGWMDDFRFRRSAVYTDDFTPPGEW